MHRELGSGDLTRPLMLLDQDAVDSVMMVGMEATQRLDPSVTVNLYCRLGMAQGEIGQAFATVTMSL